MEGINLKNSKASIPNIKGANFQMSQIKRNTTDIRTFCDIWKFAFQVLPTLGDFDSDPY